MKIFRLFLQLFLIVIIGISNLFAQYTTLDWKLHNVGKVRQVITNMGTMDKAATNYPGLINAEFPPNSNEEHLFQGGIWIGGITPNGDTLVSETQSHYNNEFYPSADRGDTIWTVQRGDTVNIPYWPNYVGLSDQDFVCRYADDNLLNIPNHTPLHVEIIQATHAWGSSPVDEFILYDYKIIAKKIPIKNAYIAFWMHSSIGIVNTANFMDDLIQYNRTKHLVIASDAPGGEDGTAISPVGFRVIKPDDSSLRWSMTYYEHETLPVLDPDEYKAMSSGTIYPDRLDQPSRDHIILGFGPFQLKVGDTLNVEMAEIFGYGVNGLMNNSETIDFLKTKGFRVPSPPPKPITKVTLLNHGVDLNWAGSKYVVEDYTDPNRGDTVKYPFEGYRVYKSTRSINGPWTLVAQYDKIDEEGANTGLNYEYKDDGLLNNIEYYYAVTAYSKEDKVIKFPSQETSITNVAKIITPGATPMQSVGEVGVVPNPYRGDIAYNTYDPPWEKPKGSRSQWMEQDRRIQFINLPIQCQIKIYTLAGDLVFTIDHADPNKGYEDWNLTSNAGQAVSSGIYLFTVEDMVNGKVQVGKFVIIK